MIYIYIKFSIFHNVMQGHEEVLSSVVALQGLKMYFFPFISWLTRLHVSHLLD